MAITKIHGIKATVQKAIDYICNPAKTDDSILVTAFGCTPASAAIDFGYALGNTESADPNKAFHLIQSFAPGEVEYKQAHKIGVELADRLLEGRHDYIVTTHIDRGHIHNHIIFCAADNINYSKYHDCKKSYYHIRQLSDELCKENDLSIVIPSGRRGKSHKQWQAEKEGTSWKQQMKDDIDASIKDAQSYEEFIVLMKSKGYIVTGENFGENEPKYIKFEMPGVGRATRGSEKNFGKGYTKEDIRDRIVDKQRQRTAPPKPSFKPDKNYASRNLVDTSTDKFQSSPGLQHWATIENLKIAAAAYSEANSIKELDEKISQKKSLAKSARSSLVSTQKEMKELAEIIKYAEQYQKNRIFHVRYEKSKDPEAYFRRHDTELTLYDGACNILKRYGIEPKTLNIEKLKSQYQALASQKADFEATYKSAEKEASALQKKLDTLEQYLGTPEQDRKRKDQTIS